MSELHDDGKAFYFEGISSYPYPYTMAKPTREDNRDSENETNIGKLSSRKMRALAKTSISFNDIALDFDSLFIDADRLTDLEGASFDAILRPYGVRTVLDCACGTGFQCIGLARRGYLVSASDISPRMVKIVKEKAACEGLAIDVKRADFRNLKPWIGMKFDAVISGGNSLTLLSYDEDIFQSIKCMLACTKVPDGLGVISMHNYVKLMKEGKSLLIRKILADEKSTELLLDLRRFGEERTQVTHFFLKEKNNRWRLKTYTKSYRMLTPEDLCNYMLKAGYRSATLLDVTGQRPYNDDEWVLAVGIV